MSKEEQEGTVTLDPETLAREEAAAIRLNFKSEEMKALNSVVTEALKIISEEHGMKLCMLAYSPKHDEIGIWNSSNVNQFDEMAFSKMSNSQF